MIFYLRTFKDVEEPRRLFSQLIDELLFILSRNFTLLCEDLLVGMSKTYISILSINRED